MHAFAPTTEECSGHLRTDPGNQEVAPVDCKELCLCRLPMIKNEKAQEHVATKELCETVCKVGFLWEVYLEKETAQISRLP